MEDLSVAWKHLKLGCEEATTPQDLSPGEGQAEPRGPQHLGEGRALACTLHPKGQPPPGLEPPTAWLLLRGQESRCRFEGGIPEYPTNERLGKPWPKGK